MISSDTVTQSAAGRGRHGLDAVVLSDADLRITDLYNLRTTRNVAPKKGMIVDLPIPTTFLVGADGLVKWVDQADDYMIRSAPDRVRCAIVDRLDGAR